jgi:hypothetical protein
MDFMMMERVGDRWEKMEGSCSTGQSPQWAVVPVEEKEEEEKENFIKIFFIRNVLEHHFITVLIPEVMWRPVRSEWSGTREGEKCV